MSDDFDREAERERLREKYERDQAKREATEQMSELLLQGATMTNRHCPECHSPVFRYDGQEFCPTCQREVTDDGELAGEAAEGVGEGEDESPTADGTAADAATNGDAGEAVQQDRSADAATPADAEATTDAAKPTQDPEASTTDSGPDADDRPAETRPATTRERRPARVDPPARHEEPTARREAPAEGGDLGEAEAALVREITDLTRRAEETRDVGRERDLFEAAREATETLRELRRL